MQDITESLLLKTRGVPYFLSYEMDLVSLSYTWLICRCAQMLFSVYFCQTRGGRSG